jgi:TetR/AcrR family transcriptional regulator, transcriptional repressor for nem operon
MAGAIKRVKRPPPIAATPSRRRSGGRQLFDFAPIPLGYTARRAAVPADGGGEALKVSKQQAAANRERILTEAAKMIRERGIAGSGVDALAGAAGLTHGSLYSQFGSKDRLAAAALGHALGASAGKLVNHETLADYVDEYLSEGHRGRLGEGCALAALASEMPRQNAPARNAFTAGVTAMVGRLARLVADRPDPEGEALAIAATLVGGLILARGVNDSELSDRILAASRAALLPAAGAEPQGAQRGEECSPDGASGATPVATHNNERPDARWLACSGAEFTSRKQPSDAQ